MPRKSQIEVAQRRQRIEELLNEGVTSPAAILAQLEREGIPISDRQMRRDLAQTAKEWAASVAKLRSLRQMHLVHQAEKDSERALAEWERSGLDKKQRKSRAKKIPGRPGKDGKKVAAQTETSAEETTEGRLRDPAYLLVRAKIREFIAEVLGLKEPERKELTGADGGPVIVKTIHGKVSMRDL